MSASHLVMSDEMFFENGNGKVWLSCEQAARYLAMSTNALRIMVHRKQVKAYKFRRRLKFLMRDLELLINEEA